MSDPFFPQHRTSQVVVFDFLEQVLARTIALQATGGLGVWTGPSRMGKTTSAKLLVKRVTEHYDAANPLAFRAVHYTAVGDSGERRHHRLPKRGIRSLYEGSLNLPMDEEVYRNRLPQALAHMTVDALVDRRIGIVLVDEAGTLDLEEIRGIISVYDEAARREERLTIVLLGMDDIALKMHRLPQALGRAGYTWETFEPYSLKDTWDFLAALHPHFSGLDRSADDAQLQVGLVHGAVGGVPGFLVHFLHEFDSIRRRSGNGPVNSTFVRGVVLHLTQRVERALKSECGPAPSSVTAPTRRRSNKEASCQS